MAHSCGNGKDGSTRRVSALLRPGGHASRNSREPLPIHGLRRLPRNRHGLGSVCFLGFYSDRTDRYDRGTGRVRAADRQANRQPGHGFPFPESDPWSGLRASAPVYRPDGKRDGEREAGWTSETSRRFRYGCRTEHIRYPSLFGVFRTSLALPVARGAPSGDYPPAAASALPTRRDIPIGGRPLRTNRTSVASASMPYSVSRRSGGTSAS